MFDLAQAAVEAALAAGARYADARVMDRRHEAMGARNGEVEELTQEASVGIGVRALIGSGCIARNLTIIPSSPSSGMVPSTSLPSRAGDVLISTIP